MDRCHLEIACQRVVQGPGEAELFHQRQFDDAPLRSDLPISKLFDDEEVALSGPCFVRPGVVGRGDQGQPDDLSRPDLFEDDAVVVEQDGHSEEGEGGRLVRAVTLALCRRCLPDLVDGRVLVVVVFHVSTDDRDSAREGILHRKKVGRR